MIPSLQVNKPAYYDTFAGLVHCIVQSLSGQSTSPTSGVKVVFKITRDHGPYKKGEVLTCSSLWVCPKQAIRQGRFSKYIRHYTVG